MRGRIFVGKGLVSRQKNQLVYDVEAGGIASRGRAKFYRELTVHLCPPLGGNWGASTNSAGALHVTTKKQRAGSGAQSNAATNAGLIEIQIQYRAVADLLLDSRNPRQHSQRQVNQLADSIQEFGFVMPVVVDHKGQVVIGHGRVLAAKKLGMPRLPVVEIRHLSPAQLKALRIADNRLAQNAHWDERLR